MHRSGHGPVALLIALSIGFLLTALVPLLRGERASESAQSAPPPGTPAEVGSSSAAVPEAGAAVPAKRQHSLLRALSAPLAALMGVLIGLGLCLTRRDLAKR
jgi:hypothetical protein